MAEKVASDPDEIEQTVSKNASLRIDIRAGNAHIRNAGCLSQRAARTRQARSCSGGHPGEDVVRGGRPPGRRVSRTPEARRGAILAPWLTTLHGTGPSTTR